MGNLIIVIIVITAVVSYMAWQKQELFSKLLFSPYFIIRRNQYYRFITHGFVHANWPHLIINMLVFWSFGSVLLQYFEIVWSKFSNLLFIGFYLAAIILSSIYSFVKNKDNSSYSAVGASGATSAIVFASIFFDPWNKVYFFGFIPIPGVLFGVLYLVYSYRMAKKGTDNIGHDAHFWGAVFGFLFPIMLKPELVKHFIHSIMTLPI